MLEVEPESEEDDFLADVWSHRSTTPPRQKAALVKMFECEICRELFDEFSAAASHEAGCLAVPTTSDRDSGISVGDAAPRQPSRPGRRDAAGRQNLDRRKSLNEELTKLRGENSQPQRELVIERSHSPARARSIPQAHGGSFKAPSSTLPLNARPIPAYGAVVKLDMKSAPLVAVATQPGDTSSVILVRGLAALVMAGLIAATAYMIYLDRNLFNVIEAMNKKSKY